jgi:hypothetical protein
LRIKVKWKGRQLSNSATRVNRAVVTEVADFQGKLPGRTRAWTDDDTVCCMWKLFFPGGTLYVQYRFAACNPELEGPEVEATVQSNLTDDGSALLRI